MITTAMATPSTHLPSGKRVPLGTISDNSLNIAKQAKPASGKTSLRPISLDNKSMPSSNNFFIPYRPSETSEQAQPPHSPSSKRSISSLDQQNPTQSQRTPSFKRAKFYDNDKITQTADIFTSPTLEKARTLKIKLQLAYYKVRTNQTDVRLQDMLTEAVNIEQEDADNDKPVSIHNSSFQFQTQTRSAINDLLAASTPIIGKQRTLQMTRSLSNPTPQEPSTSLNFVRKPAALKRSSSTMDDIVKKRGVSANLKRASADFMKSIPNLHHPTDSNNNNEADQRQPTQISSSSASTSNSSNTMKPINKLLLTSLSSSTTTHTTTSPSKFAFTSPLEEQFNQQKTKFRLPPVPSFAYDISPIRRTLKVSNNNVANMASASATATASAAAPVAEQQQKMFVTPVRKVANHSKNFQGNRDNDINENDNDNYDIQLMSSPTRLMSTPSSIGAARCLLQLAHR